MHTVKIVLDSKPVSVNNMFYNNKSHGKKAEVRDWELEIVNQLWRTDNLKALETLRTNFNPDLHCFHVTLTFEWPRNIFYAKAGNISSRSMDLSNVEKPLLDLIFTNQYYGDDRPSTVPNVNVDDKFVTRLLSVKIPAEKHRITAEISIEPKP